ncbi:MAG: hypothetical protein D6717_00365 [Gammaproteobacteria bacterium]|nr:MAG: hypothetical protein D6717_00365 [Gammaproteobacteria bacterium]
MIEIRVNGRRFSGWTGVRVSRTIERLSGAFELSMTSRDPVDVPIAAGDLCQILIDGQQLLAGAVDDRVVRYDAGEHTVAIAGRDATADLVDCSAETRQFRNLGLDAIAREICKPFSIQVLVDADVGKPFASVQPEPGQTCHEFLATLAAHRGVLLAADDLGNLRITRPGRTRSPGTIEFGGNVLACNTSISMRDRFSEYTALHQGVQSDAFNGTVATQASGRAKDPVVPRPRPLTVLAEDGQDLAARAANERNVRAGRGERTTYTVSGWHAAADALWQPNTIVAVTDPHQHPPLHRVDRLIASVTYLFDEDGTRTDLDVMPPGAFDLLAVPEPAGVAW